MRKTQKARKRSYNHRQKIQIIIGDGSYVRRNHTDWKTLYMVYNKLKLTGISREARWWPSHQSWPWEATNTNGKIVA